MSDQLKRDAAKAAMDWLAPKLTPDMVIGIGTGATVDYFISLLANHKGSFKACVSSSGRSSKCLAEFHIPELAIDQVTSVFVYVDGIDEGTQEGILIKGGGAAMSREKIIATLADQFLCIADESKFVLKLGVFPLPIEVMPVAIPHVSEALKKMGGIPKVREGVITDNGNVIIDCGGFDFSNPEQLEVTINSLPGVLDNGVFALRKADLMFIASGKGIQPIVID